MRNLARRAVGWIWLAVMGLPLAAWAQQAGELTGIYTKEGGELAILQGDNETLVRYEAGFPQGESVGTCECPFVAQRRSGERWALRSEDAEGEWALRVAPGKLVVEGSGLGCCGAGWPGRDEFKRTPAKPLASCKVKAPRAYFRASDAANTQRKAYVVAGDSVEAIIPASEPDLVPARFKGPRKSTVGLLERTQLECAAPGATASAGASTVKAEQLQPLAGTWLELTKKGKGYVIFKPCSAETRSFTVKPATGELEVQLGQESTTAKVTKLEPGSGAGAYVLELTQEGGSPERVEWKAADAGKGIVSLNSADLFSRSHTYVRSDKKGAYPREVEKNCGEYE
jgi:hypothetical protein